MKLSAGLKCAALAALMLPSMALAQAFDEAPKVQAEANSDSAASVSASMDVAAPPAVVFATLRDCDHATDFMPKLISCKVIDRGPGDRWEVREHVLKGGLFQPRMRNVFRITFDAPNTISFRRVAGDWKKSQGVWRLTPLAGGKATHVTYHTEVAVNAPVPMSMVRSAVAKGMPEAMIALRRECEARAGREKSS